MIKSEIDLQELENKLATLVVYFKERLPDTHYSHAIKMAIRHAERAGWLKEVPDEDLKTIPTIEYHLNEAREQ